ncbi:membrane protein [Chlamydia abortus]|nr:sporulation-specific diadenylate cyclase CdaS [Aneurinibacillus sp. XH2]SHE12392.1 membrane protein [Chlamydia abortus]
MTNEVKTPKADCDFSPLKEQLKLDLQQMKEDIEASLEVFNNEDRCVLGQIETFKERLIQLESRAATFYLNCYLAPFTDKYVDLSISIRHLSERRHGALIAVERSEPLEWLVQPGTPIGAAITYPLLESIFYPGNPLHDGAVLVRANQIISAANVLPLTNTMFGQRKLGTRHRAAIGLSEKSDAIVLVVSEETGRSSFAYKGQLYPVINP